MYAACQPNAECKMQNEENGFMLSSFSILYLSFVPMSDSFLDKLKKVENDRVSASQSQEPPPGSFGAASGAEGDKKNGGAKKGPSLLSRLKLNKKEDAEGGATLSSISGGGTLSQSPQAGVGLSTLQLDIDMYKTPFEVVVFAQVPGVEPSELTIDVEKEGDVLTVRGTRKRPEQFDNQIIAEMEDTEKVFVSKECKWGSFYRRISLPDEVNVFEVQAKFYKGVLIIIMPLKRLPIHKRMKRKVEVEEVDENENSKS